jgi:saccharopine dehydrogenase-like NADP-dependent oxidoreductase
MSCNVIVLGAGLVGGPMALDLAADPGFTVTVADRDPAALAAVAGRGDVATCGCDFTDQAAVGALVAGFDLVLGAVPGFLGYRTLETVIAAGKSVVDIAFFPEDPFGLDGPARERGVTAVVDCGVFPGMGSALIGRAAAEMDKVDRVLVRVGGLPQVRKPPFEYAAVFSPVDVIEEYVRPARFREGGREVVRPALSDVETLELPGVGTVEAFNTDGLRTLLRTLEAPDMREKTIRYPGHAEMMALLRDSGFFSEQPVEVDGRQVRPLDLTAELLFPLWRLGPGEGDITVMRIEIEGERARRRVRRTWDLHDEFDAAAGVSSMARTTGYTATQVLRLVADGSYAAPGVSPPEYLGGAGDCVERMLAGLAQRGVAYRMEEAELD